MRIETIESKKLSSGMDKSKHAVSVFDRRATDYAARYMDVGLYHDTLDQLCSLLVPDAKLLELACGPGNITRYLLDKRPDLRITGTDLAPNMLRLAQANNPDADFSLMDMRNAATLPEKYDGVISGFGLPYLSDEESVEFIESLPKILDSGALVYLSTMEGRYETSAPQKSSDGKDEIFIHYHQADYLVGALKNSGFSIVLEKTQIFPLKPDTTDLILIAQWMPKS